MTTATIIWVLLAGGYAASTVPLARQGWGRACGRVAPLPGTLHLLRRPNPRQQRHAA